MGGEIIGAYFFIPPDRRPPEDDELFRTLGCDLARSSFGTLTIADRVLSPLSDHACASLYFLKQELINRLADAPDQEPPLERDPLLPFATAIREGAARLAAEVAFLEIRNAELEAVLDRYYWMVLARDPDALAGEWPSLLYMDDTVIRGWEPGPALIDRDELPGGPGRTLFGARGGNRWF